jgi:hypothetical protein
MSKFATNFFVGLAQVFEVKNNQLVSIFEEWKKVWSKQVFVIVNLKCTTG